MEYDVEKREVVSNKELNNLDKFVLEFLNILEKYTNYVIVSGYVAIVLGRSRATEDVDFLIPKMDKKVFTLLFNELLNNNFECVNTSNVDESFEMLREHAVRFFKKGFPTPNIEFKIIKNDLDKYSFENKIKVKINNKQLFISPLEVQVAYKLFLAADGTDEELDSDKDIEDARHIYKHFKEKFNKDEFTRFIDKLNVKKRLRHIE